MRHAWLKHNYSHRSFTLLGTELPGMNRIRANNAWSSVMRLSVKAVDIVRAQIVPWEAEAGEFGIAWDLADGRSGLDRVGSRENAELLMSILKRERKAERAAIPSLFPKHIAAS
jgi:hypothetical protein